MKNLFRGKLSLFVLISCVSLMMSVQSCAVKLVPKKDPTMIVDVIDGSSATENMFDNMVTSGNRTYATYATDYESISSRIDSIYKRDSVRAKAKFIVMQVEYLRTAFNQYWDYHKKKGTLTLGECKITQAYLRGFWKPVKVSEMSLR